MKKGTQPMTILIAEDDPDDQLLCQDALKQSKAEYDLHFVENGQEVMDYLRRTGAYENATNVPRPSLVILDLNMPMMNGIKCLEEIKKIPALAELRVVLYSTTSEKEFEEQSKKAGAYAFFVKPTRTTELANYLRRLVFS